MSTSSTAPSTGLSTIGDNSRALPSTIPEDALGSDGRGRRGRPLSPAPRFPSARPLLLLLLPLLCLLGDPPIPGGPRPAEAQTAAPVSIVDDLGRRVTLPRPARRVVSLYAAHTENGIALGGRAAFVAAAYGDDPTMIRGLPRMPQRPGPETILALSPDLVLLRPLNARTDPNLTERLARFGIPCAVLEPPDPDRLLPYLERLGALLGRRAAARRAAAEAEALFAGADRSGREGTPFFFVVDPRAMTTCSPGSWAERMLAAAGGRNLAPDARPLAGSAVAAFGPERLVALGERVSVLLVQRGPMNDLPAAEVARDPRIASLRAVQEGRVFEVPEVALRPSLLRLRDGIALLRNRLGTRRP